MATNRPESPLDADGPSRFVNPRGSDVGIGRAPEGEARSTFDFEPDEMPALFYGILCKNNPHPVEDMVGKRGRPPPNAHAPNLTIRRNTVFEPSRTSFHTVSGSELAPNRPMDPGSIGRLALIGTISPGSIPQLAPISPPEGVSRGPTGHHFTASRRK